MATQAQNALDQRRRQLVLPLGDTKSYREDSYVSRQRDTFGDVRLILEV